MLSFYIKIYIYEKGGVVSDNAQSREQKNGRFQGRLEDIFGLGKRNRYFIFIHLTSIEISSSLRRLEKKAHIYLSDYEKSSNRTIKKNRYLI